MRLGWHLRGWIVAFLVALALTMVVAIPPAYIHQVKHRHVYVGIMIPGMCLLYMWVLHRSIAAPMSQTLVTLRCGQAKSYTRGARGGVPIALTKELQKLQAAVGILCQENEMMRRFVDEGPLRQHNHSVTPVRPHNDSFPLEPHHHQQTPATIARDIMRDEGELVGLVPTVSSSSKGIRRKARGDAQRTIEKEELYTPGGDDHPPYVAPDHVNSNFVFFSAPCSDDELSLHSFPPSPAA